MYAVRGGRLGGSEQRPTCNGIRGQGIALSLFLAFHLLASRHNQERLLYHSLLNAEYNVVDDH